jgi:2-polyprenyl-3-methyl-5-hydroxy-6-metoxy-1,4-benzoquinol methylase
MNKSEKFFDRVSSKSSPEPNQTASKIIGSSKEFLEKDNYVLDFGCGSGAITNKLAEAAKAIDAIDISSGMLEFAKRQAKENSIGNINYLQTTIFNERFENESFDAILAFNVLHYIEDMPSLMERINWLLKPNGIFITSTACLKENKNGIRLAMWLLNKLKIVPKTIFYKKSDLENLITKGGFRIKKSELISSLPESFIVGEKEI